MAKKKKASKKGADGGKSKDAKASSEATPAVNPPSKEEQLWAARYMISEQQRRSHMSNASLLVKANASLEERMQETERDTIEVVAFLQRETAQLKDELRAAKNALKDVQLDAQKQVDRIRDEYDAKLSAMEQDVHDKQLQISTLNSELQAVKVFRQQRNAMEREVRELRQQHDKLAADYALRMQQMQTKYLEEKARQQQLHEEQLRELTHRAHDAAVRSLDVSTKSMYEDNLQLEKAVKLHMQEAKQLKQVNRQLKEDLQAQTSAAEEYQGQASEAQAKLHRLTRAHDEQQTKITELENTLTNTMQELADSRDAHKASESVGALEHQTKLDAAQQALNIKQAELKQIKTLARNLLHQRTEVEQFFLESIALVKEEIKQARIDYLRANKRTTLPSIHPDRRIREEFEAAETVPEHILKVDIKTMTWEQRQQVLKYLLAKINGASDAKQKAAEQRRERERVNSGRARSHREGSGRSQLNATAPQLALPTGSGSRAAEPQASDASAASFFLTDLAV
ncbi:uncharacterized protein MONBRDRAFT_23035 [Monosiga brevicollis MX1]|uniref:Basal body-orientation factor 1 n=1 Tax=Monosiga brevicollis TaxID=81824 RepID=A9UST8_MONBE|nr:uncharacterized protein MONBRDRAFT_23035 [Monosiga brevicollis MX1]EDQ92161.1 predicted protein [Monosiga brevicollis MX1]|eukprot:XP_001743447.1 hypothetical protein [Monosiga brevicollis MX1]